MNAAGAKLHQASLAVLGAIAFGFSTGSGAVAANDVDAVGGSSDDYSVITTRTNAVLQLEVVINGRPMGKVGQFVIRAGQPFARQQDLRGFGIRLPSSVPDDQSLVGLGDLNGLAVRIDQPSQTIFIDAADDWLLPNILAERSAPDNFKVESGTGATLNYDLVGTAVSGHESLSGLADLRAFSRLGVISSDVLFHTNSGSDRRGGFDIVRLDTSYVYSDPGSLRRYRAGDFISGSLPWTRPVRLGGVQINLDFSMRPDLITFPVPSVSGSAAVPSTVDVLVNGTTVRSGSVAPGPFEVPQVPVISGAGTVTTTVTDALGRQVTTELPFYASPTLLAPGLQTYSAEIGLVRRDWGTVSNDYGDLAAAITYRGGLSTHLTVEGHAEHTDGLSMGGLGGVMNIGDFALARLALAGSSWSGRTGGQIAAAVERTTPHYHLGTSIILASDDFGDIAALNDDPIPTRQLNANASVYLARIGSLGIAYTEVKRGSVIRARDLAPGGLSLSSSSHGVFPEHSKLLTASYSRQVGFGSFYATAFHDFSHDNRTTALVGLTMPLGSRTTANVSAQAGNGSRSAQVELSRTAIVPGDWGFRLFAAEAQHDSTVEPARKFLSDHEFGQVTYKANFGEFSGGFDRNDGQTTFQGQASGAVSLIDGAVFASNRIDDSFAVVDTAGAPGIRVRQENRDVGRTNSRGRFLVPDLRSFEINQLSIEPLDAPITADVPLTRREVRPQDRSGVIVRLPVINKRSALLKLVDVSGKAIRVGSAATLSSTGVAVPVGYDGEAFLVDLQSRNEVVVEQPDGRRCVATFDYQATAYQIPVLGPLQCRDQAR